MFFVCGYGSQPRPIYEASFPRPFPCHAVIVGSEQLEMTPPMTWHTRRCIRFASGKVRAPTFSVRTGFFGDPFRGVIQQRPTPCGSSIGRRIDESVPLIRLPIRRKTTCHQMLPVYGIRMRPKIRMEFLSRCTDTNDRFQIDLSVRLRLDSVVNAA